MISNQRIARILNEIADFLEIQGVEFKPRAYRRAARGLTALGQEAAEIYQNRGLKGLEEISGVGQHIALKLEELIKTGHLDYYEKLKKELPIEIEELTAIEGLGVKTAFKLYQALGIKNLEDLEKAIKQGKIKEVKGFGKKTEQELAQGLEFVKGAKERFLLAEVEPVARRLQKKLKDLPSTGQVVIAGSFRRRKATVGDLDIVAASQSPDELVGAFISQPEISHIYSQGEGKVLARLKIGLDVDLRVARPESFGALLLAFTGSKDHEVALRKLAQRQGYKLNEYGLFKGNKRLAASTEKEIYENLGLAYIEPELRENQGELEATKQGKLPKLVGYNDIKGDLQVHTTASDGENTLGEMVEAARALGYEYIAVTDHSQSQYVAGGQNWAEIQAQWQDIDKLSEKYPDFKILKSAEVEIKKDGSLDFDNKQLKQFDIVLGAVHSYFNLSQNEQTQRIIKAMENPYLDILAHPTGRILGRRAGYKIDTEKLLKAAKRTGTLLEINASPNRLDLRDTHIKLAVEAGVKLVISTDAHSRHQLDFIKYGVAQGRRGWAEKEDILNTLPLAQFLKNLRKKSAAR